jgi:hypothetical protein
VRSEEVADLDDGILVDLSSDKESISAHRLFFRSGRLVFMVVVESSLTSPVPEGEARAIAVAQRNRVPREIATEEPEERSLARSFAVALVPLAIGAGAFFVFMRQRAARRREADRASAPSAPE